MHTTATTPSAARLGAVTARLYGVYAWVVLVLIVTPILPVFIATRSTQRARRIARSAAGVFFWAIGSRVRVDAALMPQAGPCVVVANHSSYLDGIILTAALPPHFTFVIKHEMSAVPIARLVLGRLGSEFVRRDDATQRQRAARRLVTAAASGNALAFFPEGTFDETPGLKPFQLGAFAAASRAAIPVVPVVISGARRKLGAERWLPAPGPLAVKVCAPVDPADYASARALMTAARNAILEHLEEPDRLEPADALGEPEPPAAGL